jgi:putative transposase
VATLQEAGLPIASSTYYAARSRPPSKRALRDEELRKQIMKIYTDNFSVYGARKIWKELHRRGEQVARCTVERLMRELGIRGAVRGTDKIRTTRADPHGQVLGDKVERDFTADAPNRLWVADFTYVATWSGIAFVAFVTDVYSRKIVGWRAADHMRTDLVLDALEMAMWHRGEADLSRLVHHSDRGAQYTAIRYTQRLVDAGADPSVGSTGDSYDKPSSSHCSPLVLSRGFRLEVRRAPVGEGHALGDTRGVGAGGLEEVAVLVVVGDALDQAVAPPDLDGLFAGADGCGVFGEGEQAAFA